MTVRAELTIEEAADFLNISGPYLVKLLDENGIPYTTVGTERRIQLDDLLAFKIKDDVRRENALVALAAQAQDEGFGYACE